MVRISIIIPVYNVKDYLPRCLDSVTKQTVKDYQCLLVDDGSTDGCGELCDEYARKDTRFVVTHIAHGGPSVSRNIGLDMVNSPWVTFIDSDDYVDEHYLENFLKNNETNSSTQVIQGYHCMGYESEDKQTLYKGTTYSFQEANVGIRSIFIEENNILHNHAVWCKIFSMEVIRKYNIHFDEHLYCGEDGVFWHQYLCHVNKIVFIPERGYTYFCPLNFDSVSRGRHPQTVDTWLALANNYKQISAVLPQRFCMSRKYASYIKMFYWHNYFRALLKPKKLTSTQVAELKRLQPGRLQMILTPKGFVYWLLNFLPISWLRAIRELIA